MEIWITTGTIIALLVLSAFFSAAETSLTTVSRARIHILSKKGNRRAGIIKHLHEQKERLIGAILLANNLVNILASALATSFLIGLFGERGVAYATVGMTLLVVFFGEIMPKTFALNNTDKTAMFVAPLIGFCVRLFSPVTHAAQITVKAILDLFGISAKADIGMTTADELRGAIELHAGTGRRIKQQQAMLRSILDLSHVEVREIMLHRKDVFMVNAEQPAEALADEILKAPFTRTPLWLSEPDNIVGIMHNRILLSAMRKQERALTREEIIALAARPWFIPESTTLLQQLQAFRQRREHFALVVDEYGAWQGIVTLEDILEEIVGEIADEFDAGVPGVRAQGDGSFIVAGNVTIRDLNRQFDWQLPDDEAATLAGLVLHESRHIPQAGQVFHFYGFRFEILRRERNHLTSLRVTPPSSRPALTATGSATPA